MTQKMKLEEVETIMEVNLEEASTVQLLNAGVNFCKKLADTYEVDSLESRALTALSVVMATAGAKYCLKLMAQEASYQWQHQQAEGTT